MEFKNKFDKQFTEISREILANGRRKEERNGLRISLFGQTLRSNLKDGFPVHTQKHTAWDVALDEWLNFIKGSTNASDFNSTIWNQWGLTEDDVRITVKDGDAIVKSVIDLISKEEDYPDFEKRAEEGIAAGSITVEVLDFETREKKTLTEELPKDVTTDMLAPALEKHNASERISAHIIGLDILPENTRETTTGIACLINELSLEETHARLAELREIEGDAAAWQHDTFNGTITERHVITPAGYLGPIYGAVWAGKVDGVDQIDALEEAIRKGGDTRMVINGWLPHLLPDSSKTHDENILDGKQVLPPCHVVYVFDLFEGTLNLEMLQRSGDWWVGVPFNHVHLGYWVESLAYVHGLEVGEIKHDITNAHIYGNQLDVIDADAYLDSPSYALPRLVIDNPEAKSIKDLKMSDFIMVNYESGPYIKLPVSS